MSGNIPLAAKLRPTTLEEFVGQDHILGPGKLLRIMIEKDLIRSLILFGPPGTGKTTLAKIIANYTSSKFVMLHAATDGAKSVKDVVKDAKTELDINNVRTIVCTDEIHRQPKNVQDIYLGAVEDGIITLIGLTTQNPYFAMVSALISRSQLFEFKALSVKDLLCVAERAKEYYKAHDKNLIFKTDAIEWLINKSSGDARKLLNCIELLAESTDGPSVNIDIDMCKDVIPQQFVVFDKSGDEHYDALSAIQNAIQFSDVDGALFWLAWAIKHNVDIGVICRRLLVTACEDIGICDPMVLVYTNTAVEAALKVGYPEANLILSSAVAYLAMSPRSKASARAIWRALKMNEDNVIDVPDSIKDCHYKGSERLGRGLCKDGVNAEEYHKVFNNIFIPENGLETKLWKYNQAIWAKSSGRAN